MFSIILKESHKKLRGRGIHPDFLLNLVLRYPEIAVDQQPRAGDRTFEGAPESGPMPIFGPILAQLCKMT